jgi:hypothetical protein
MPLSKAQRLIHTFGCRTGDRVANSPFCRAWALNHFDWESRVSPPLDFAMWTSSEESSAAGANPLGTRMRKTVCPFSYKHLEIPCCLCHRTSVSEVGFNLQVKYDRGGGTVSVVASSVVTGNGSVRRHVIYWCIYHGIVVEGLLRILLLISLLEQGWSVLVRVGEKFR